MTFIQVVHIVASDISHVTKKIYLFIFNTCNIRQVYLCRHSAKRMMKYDPGKIEIHGYKLHV